MIQQPDIALLPCPFCGSAAKFEYDGRKASFRVLSGNRSPRGLQHATCWIDCDNGACPIIFGIQTDEYDEFLNGGQFTSFAQAAMEWNKRR